MFALSERDLKRLGKSGPDIAPDDGTYQWTDRQGRIHTIPNGIDPGWDYNVGERSWKPDLSRYPKELRRLIETETRRL